MKLRKLDIGGLNPDNDTVSTDAPKPRLQLTSSRDIQLEQHKEPQWAVDGLIPEGLTILAGPPKTGKSWLAYALSVSVASGGKALGSIDVQSGSAIYLALEDSHLRLQKRYGIMMPGEAGLDNLFLTTKCPRLNEEGGLACIEGALDEHPDCRVLIIDTFARVRPTRQRGGQLYDEDTQALAPLQRLAQERHVAIIVVHHTRKRSGDAGDFVEELSGSNGLAGVADCIMVMRRTRGEQGISLWVTGRDIEEKELALQFDPITCTHRLLGEASEVVEGATANLIIDLLKTAGEPLGPKNIATLLGKSYPSIKQSLYRLSNKGSINHRLDGKYSVTPVTNVTALPPLPSLPCEDGNGNAGGNEARYHVTVDNALNSYGYSEKVTKVTQVTGVALPCPLPRNPGCEHWVEQAGRLCSYLDGITCTFDGNPCALTVPKPPTSDEVLAHYEAEKAARSLFAG